MTHTTHRRFASLLPRLAFLALGLLLTSGTAWARPTQPTAADRQITLAVSI